MTGPLAAIVVVCSTVAGSALGSYAGVVRSRGWRASVHGRSRCEACHRELRWYELVPLASYALQGGRCRRCGAPIGLAAVLVEVLGAALGAAIAISVVLSLAL
jgi:leader peptidase (prepilin peptidase)/N-methyltransferase